MVQSGWFKDRILFVVLHDYTHTSQNKHVWGCQSNKSVGNQAEEVISAGRELIDIL